MMVVLVALQMLVQVIDSLCEESDLNFGGAGVAFMLCISGNDLGFVHGKFLL